MQNIHISFCEIRKIVLGTSYNEKLYNYMYNVINRFLLINIENDKIFVLLCQEGKNERIRNKISQIYVRR